MSFKLVKSLLILNIFLPACGSVKGSVSSSHQPLSPLSPIISEASGNMALKRSPGDVTSTSASLSAKSTITTTNRKLVGSALSAKVTLSQGRANP